MIIVGPDTSLLELEGNTGLHAYDVALRECE